MSDSIQVLVRVRPLNEREINSGTFSCWKNKNEQNLIQTDKDGRPLPGAQLFSFDRVFWNENNQRVFSEVQSLVSSSLQGFNATVFAYGQTSSGKTYTMHGGGKELGVIPLAMQEIFTQIQSTPQREFLLRVSYLEIYNEVIKDLLNPENDNLKIHETPEREIFVGNVREEIVTSPEDITQLMKSGEKNRHVGVTNMNERSSRSHTIFQMVIESRDIDSENTSFGAVKVSQLNFVDLAGSERFSHTGAEGTRLKEGGHINKSLLTLGTVISKLSENSSHVPYRDSKLTRILQNSLGGNAKTAIICTITPANQFVEETYSTLKFASRAKTVTNKPEMNEIVSDEAMLKRYQTEIKQLKNQLEQLQQDDKIQQFESVVNEKLEIEAQAMLHKKSLEEYENRQRQLENKIQTMQKLILNPHESPQISQEQKRQKIIRRQTWYPGAQKKLKSEKAEIPLLSIDTGKNNKQVPVIIIDSDDETKENENSQSTIYDIKPLQSIAKPQAVNFNVEDSEFFNNPINKQVQDIERIDAEIQTDESYQGFVQLTKKIEFMNVESSTLEDFLNQKDTQISDSQSEIQNLEHVIKQNQTLLEAAQLSRDEQKSLHDNETQTQTQQADQLIKLQDQVYDLQDCKNELNQQLQNFYVGMKGYLLKLKDDLMQQAQKYENDLADGSAQLQKQFQYQILEQTSSYSLQIDTLQKQINDFEYIRTKMEQDYQNLQLERDQLQKNFDDASQQMQKAEKNSEESFVILEKEDNTSVDLVQKKDVITDQINSQIELLQNQLLTLTEEKKQLIIALIITSESFQQLKQVLKSHLKTQQNQKSELERLRENYQIQSQANTELQSKLQESHHLQEQTQQELDGALNIVQTQRNLIDENSNVISTLQNDLLQQQNGFDHQFSEVLNQYKDVQSKYDDLLYDFSLREQQYMQQRQELLKQAEAKSYAYQNVCEDFSDLKISFQQSSEQIKELQSNVDNLEVEKQNLLIKLDDAILKVGSLEIKSEELEIFKQEIEELKQEKQILLQELEGAKSKLQSREQEHFNLQELLDEKDTQLNQIVNENQNFKSLMAEQDGILQLKENSIVNLNNELQTLKSSINSLQQKVHDFETKQIQNSETQNSLESFQNENEILKQEIQKLQAELDIKIKENSDFNANMGSLVQEVDSAKDDLLLKQSEIDRLSQQYSADQETIVIYQTQAEQMQIRNDELQRRLTDLERFCSELQKSKSTISEKLSQLNNDNQLLIDTRDSLVKEVSNQQIRVGKFKEFLQSTGQIVSELKNNVCLSKVECSEVLSQYHDEFALKIKDIQLCSFEALEILLKTNQNLEQAVITQPDNSKNADKNIDIASFEALKVAFKDEIDRNRKQIKEYQDIIEGLKNESELAKKSDLLKQQLINDRKQYQLMERKFENMISNLNKQLNDAKRALSEIQPELVKKDELIEKLRQNQEQVKLIEGSSIANYPINTHFEVINSMRSEIQMLKESKLENQKELKQAIGLRNQDQQRIKQLEQEIQSLKTSNFKLTAQLKSGSQIVSNTKHDQIENEENVEPIIKKYERQSRQQALKNEKPLPRNRNRQFLKPKQEEDNDTCNQQ